MNNPLTVRREAYRVLGEMSDLGDTLTGDDQHTIALAYHRLKAAIETNVDVVEHTLKGRLAQDLVGLTWC